VLLINLNVIALAVKEIFGYMEGYVADGFG